MKYFIVLLTSLFIATVNAEVFKSVDQNGNITYSDEPAGKNAEVVTLPPDYSTSNSRADTHNASDGKQEEGVSNPPTELQLDRKPYTEFSLLSPKDQETFHNQPVISVDLKVQPELQKGDTIQLYLDGAAQGNPAAATHFELKTVDRGAHQIYAVLLDGNKNHLKQTMIITIYVHQASLGPANKTGKQ